MRRLGALLLLLAVAAPIRAADPPAEEMTSVPWYRWAFLGERPKPVAPKPAATKPVVARAPTKEEAARSLEQEQAVYLQRLAAISKIRLIAEERGDDDLRRKADDLERQADEVFRQRTAKLTGSGDDRGKLDRTRDEGTGSADASRRRNPRGTDR